MAEHPGMFRPLRGRPLISFLTLHFVGNVDNSLLSKSDSWPCGNDRWCAPPKSHYGYLRSTVVQRINGRAAVESQLQHEVAVVREVKVVVSGICLHAFVIPQLDEELVHVDVRDGLDVVQPHPELLVEVAEAVEVIVPLTEEILHWIVELTTALQKRYYKCFRKINFKLI